MHICICYLLLVRHNGTVAKVISPIVPRSLPLGASVVPPTIREMDLYRETPAHNSNLRIYLWLTSRSNLHICMKPNG